MNKNIRVFVFTFFSFLLLCFSLPEAKAAFPVKSMEAITQKVAGESEQAVLTSFHTEKFSSFPKKRYYSQIRDCKYAQLSFAMAMLGAVSFLVGYEMLLGTLIFNSPVLVIFCLILFPICFGTIATYLGKAALHHKCKPTGLAILGLIFGWFERLALLFGTYIALFLASKGYWG